MSRGDTIHSGFRALLVTTLLAIAACSSATDSEVESDAPASTAPETTTLAEPTPTDAPTPTASDTTDATAEAPTTLLDLEPPTTDELCATLGNGGFETRRASLDRFEQSDGDLDAVRTTCGPELDRLERALAIRAQAETLDADSEPVSISDVTCSGGEYSFVVENESEIRLGVHVAFRIFEGDNAEPTSSANYPIVIWQIDPGGAQGIVGEFEVPAAEQYRCNLSARVFVADASDAGAGLDTPGDADRLGDDPVAWFGALLEDETLAIGSGDPDAAASTEDVRSLFYDDVVAVVASPTPVSRVPTAVQICSNTIDQPDPDRMSFVYFITYTDDGDTESFFRHGLFRRGADGQWRWLSAAQYFESSDFASCGS